MREEQEEVEGKGWVKRKEGSRKRMGSRCYDDTRLIGCGGGREKGEEKKTGRGRREHARTEWADSRKAHLIEVLQRAKRKDFKRMS